MLAANKKPRPATLPTTGSVQFQVFDEKGRPVPNVAVGRFANFGDPAFWTDDPKKASAFDTDFHFYNADYHTVKVRTDADGRVTVPGEYLFQGKFENQDVGPVYFHAKDLGLAGVSQVSHDQLSSGVSVTVVLGPVCHVDARVTSLGLRKAGQTVHGIVGIACQTGRWNYTIDSGSLNDHCVFDLPPGDWAIELDGGTQHITRWIHISPDQRTLDLQIDCPPTRATAMIGQPAPELQKIKAWKNGGPTTLAQLRGKVVLLEFWGWWCGPCVSAMPDLIKLHDELKDKGLVIIGVHSDSADSIAEVDRKCEPAKQRWWGGRDLPFLIALDGGGPTRVQYESRTSDGATCAAYGIESWPTTLLIDRAGRIAFAGSTAADDFRPTLDRLLANPATRP